MTLTLLCLASFCAAQNRPRWTEPHPEIPYLPQPPVPAPDWIVEHPPVNPDASPEAKALLHMLYQVSGHYTLTGQHNFANEQELNTNFQAIFAGKAPAIYGTDIGFSAAGDKDSAYVRHETVQTLIKKFHQGHVIALCWHEVPPTMDEPVRFFGQIQSRITEPQFEDLLTPGTAINKHWLAQVDGVAEYLKELRDAHVPVLWRPFHEINGDWFWWNGVRGDATHGTKQLYRMMYDRLVNFHHLNNLLWVWNPDQPSRPDRQFIDYFPGLDWVDILGFDCYGAFQQTFYDELNALSGGKAMAISETSNPPTPDVYKTQPKWAYWMRWSMDKSPIMAMFKGLSNPQSTPTNPNGPRRFMSRLEWQTLVKDPRMLSLQDRDYLRSIGGVLKAAGEKAVRHAPPIPSNP